MPVKKRRRRTTTGRRTTARRRTRKTASSLSLSVDSHVAREIWAVVFLATSILMGLSISGKLGFIGGLLNNLMMPVFGWGIYVVPLIIGVIGMLMLFAPQIEIGIVKIVGLMGLLGGVLGIFHLSVDPNEIHAVAKAGEYGGYVGFVTSFLTRAVVGDTGAYVVLITMILVSVMLTFEISLVQLISYLKPEFKFDRKLKEKTDDLMQNRNVNFIPEINVIKPEIPPSPSAVASGGNEDTLKLKEIFKPKFESGNDDKGGADSSSKKSNNIVTQSDVSDDSDTNIVENNRVIEWEYPDIELLNINNYEVTSNDKELKRKAELIRAKLAQFGISVTMHDVHVGPTVIQYTLKPADGIKLSKITTLKSDLALTLSARAIRIEAPIPGKPFVGIEIPNDTRQIVSLRGMIESKEFNGMKSGLKLPIGRDVSGVPIIGDLVKMPHLLVAGATGSGKSVCMNTFLISLLYHNSPAELKLILIDPKRVELNAYNNIPHLLTPVVTDPEKAATALRWAVSEMNRRYKRLADAGFKNIDDFNKKAKDGESLPKIVILIDELADMMMAASKEVEASICRIAQMARAVGIHLIIATQRPSVDVITGLIKANIPARIAFTVSSSIDSRTILDGIGAEDLLGEGDMLYLPGNMGKPTRIQGVFVGSKEINRVTREVKLTMEPDFDETITSKDLTDQSVQGIPDSKIGKANGAVGSGGGDDALYEQALKVIVENRKASASFLQRRLRVGYARAARLLDELEENGVIGPSQGAKPRQIFISKEDVPA